MRDHRRKFIFVLTGLGCAVVGCLAYLLVVGRIPIGPARSWAEQDLNSSPTRAEIDKFVETALALKKQGRPGWEDALRRAASAYEGGGWHLQGQRVLNEIVSQPHDSFNFVSACRQKAQYAADREDYGTALATYDKLWPYVDAHPEILESCAVSIGSAALCHGGVLVRLDRFAEALEQYDRLLGRDEPIFVQVFGHEPVMSALSMQAYCHERLGDRDQAVATLDRLISGYGNRLVAMSGLKHWIKRAHLRDGDRKVASAEYLRDMASLWNNQELSSHPDMFEVGSRLVDGYIRAGMPWEARVTAREVLARLDANRAAWTGTGPGAESTARQHEITLLSTLQTSHETIGLPEWSIEAMERSIPLQKDPSVAANLRQQIENLKIAMAQHPEQFQKVFEKAKR